MNDDSNIVIPMIISPNFNHIPIATVTIAARMIITRLTNKIVLTKSYYYYYHGNNIND